MAIEAQEQAAPSFSQSVALQGVKPGRARLSAVPKQVEGCVRYEEHLESKNCDFLFRLSAAVRQSRRSMRDLPPPRSSISTTSTPSEAATRSTIART